MVSLLTNKALDIHIKITRGFAVESFYFVPAKILTTNFLVSGLSVRDQLHLIPLGLGPLNSSL